MESRAFIRAAGDLIEKINAGTPDSNTADQNEAAYNEVQDEVTKLFAGLGNPTLPSAYRLRDVALEAGFQLDPKLLQRLSQFEYLS